MSSAMMIAADRVRIRGGRVLVGDLGVRSMLIESLGPQDDDLRVDVGGRVISDTRRNVSSYVGEALIDYGGNPSWSTSGFRVLRLSNPGQRGEQVQVYVTDVGGGVVLSPYRVTLTYADGSQRILFAGRSLSFNPPSWPAGTLSLIPGQELLSNTSRPSAPPGSPPIWVPNGAFTL